MTTEKQRPRITRFRKNNRKRTAGRKIQYVPITLPSGKVVHKLIHHN